MYRATFDISNETYELLTKNVDLDSHPYLVTMFDFVFEDQSSLIISSDGDKARKRFGNVDEISIPISSLKLLERIPDKQERVTTLKVATDD